MPVTSYRTTIAIEKLTLAIEALVERLSPSVAVRYTTNSKAETHVYDSPSSDDMRPMK